MRDFAPANGAVFETQVTNQSQVSVATTGAAQSTR
jgi:hypothetical protein